MFKFFYFWISTFKQVIPGGKIFTPEVIMSAYMCLRFSLAIHESQQHLNKQRFPRNCILSYIRDAKWLENKRNGVLRITFEILARFQAVDTFLETQQNPIIIVHTHSTERTSKAYQTFKIKLKRREG